MSQIKVDRETQVVMSLKDLVNYVKDREDEAVIGFIEDHIEPFDAKEARRLVRKVRTKGKKSRKPREINVRRVNLRGNEEDFSEIKQYLVR